MFNTFKTLIKTNPVATGLIVVLFFAGAIKYGHKVLSPKPRKNYLTTRQLRPADVTRLENYGFETFVHAASKSSHTVTLWARRADGRWYFGSAYDADYAARMIEEKVCNPNMVDEDGRLPYELEEVYPEAPIW